MMSNISSNIITDAAKATTRFAKLSLVKSAATDMARLAKLAATGLAGAVMLIVAKFAKLSLIKSAVALSLLAVTLIATSCHSKEELINPVGKSVLPVILGEVSQADTAIIKIFKTSNTDVFTKFYDQMNNCSVKISEITGKTVYNLYKRDSITWCLGDLLEAGKTYCIDIQADQWHITEQISLPTSFSAKVESKNLDDNSEVSVYIDDSQNDSYYVISCLAQADSTNINNFVPVCTDDPKTDNVIYNELSNYSYAIFWHKTGTENCIKFTTSSTHNCTVNVKKVDKSYYKYLYINYVQDMSTDLIPIQTINKPYLGIFGGCYNVNVNL